MSHNFATSCRHPAATLLPPPPVRLCACPQLHKAPAATRTSFSQSPPHHRRAYTETMKDLDAALRAKDRRAGTAGPFFDGERFGWVEVMLFPWLARRSALSVHRGWELPTGAGFERVNAWVAACAARPSVVTNTTPGDYYADQYKSYAAKGDAASA